jgi:hypothetical protein
MREVHINKGRVGEDKGSKEIDRCPLTQRASFMISRRQAYLRI